MIALPSAAFTASILFDVLSLVADDAEHAHSYQRGAADLLRLGVTSSLGSLALELTEYLRAPAGVATSDATRKFVLDGAVIAIYLLDLAARQQQSGDVRSARARAEIMPVGLSLLGLTLLGVSSRLT